MSDADLFIPQAVRPEDAAVYVGLVERMRAALKAGDVEELDSVAHAQLIEAVTAWQACLALKVRTSNHQNRVHLHGLHTRSPNWQPIEAITPWQTYLVL